MVSWQKLAKILCLSNAPNAKLHINQKETSGQNQNTSLFKDRPINFTTKSTDPNKHIRRSFEMSETVHHTGVVLMYSQNQGYPTVNLCGMGRSNKCPTSRTSKHYIFRKAD
jgi:hypothetical protein